MNKNPLVYIVLPVYNGEKYFLEQLMSLYYQNYTNWYLIIVNDGSTDNSETIARDWISHYNLHDKVKIINKENGGVNSAVQRGLEEIKNMCDIYNTDAYVVYCDQDDIWTREKLTNQVEYMNNNSDCDISYHDLVIVDENGLLTNDSEFKTKPPKKLSFFYLGVVTSLLTSTEMMFKAKFIDYIIPMPVLPCVYQDERTVFVLSVAGANFEYIDEKLAYHRIGHQSLLKKSHEVGLKQYYINKQKLFDKLKERFPEKDLSSVLNYRYDRYVKWSDKYGLTSIKVYFLILYKYPKVFFLLIKDFINKQKTKILG